MVSTQVGLCVYQELHWYNSITACLYNHHAMCMLLFSIFFSSSRRLKRARSSQKIVIQHHQKRKPAAWRGVRRAARRARAATAYTMHDYAKYFDCTASPSIPYIHTYCMCTSYIHATYILHRTHIYKNGK